MPLFPGVGAGSNLSDVLAQENELVRQKKAEDAAMTKMFVDIALSAIGALGAPVLGAILGPAAGATVGGGMAAGGIGAAKRPAQPIGPSGGYNFKIPNRNLFSLG